MFLMLKVKQTKEDLLFEGGFTFPTANNMRDDLSNEQWGVSALLPQLNQSYKERNGYCSSWHSYIGSDSTYSATMTFSYRKMHLHLSANQII
jgi:hypothetical protein